MNWLIALLAFFVAAPQLATGRRPGGPYRIGGVVVDADTGGPVARAMVDIVARGSEGSEAADEDGRFLFEGLPPGKYSLIASAPGYGSLFYDQHGGLATAIVVGPGLDTERIVFRLARQALIYGTVTDDRGDAVRGAQVTLIEEDRDGGTQQASQRAWGQTNDLGQYRFAHLLPGKYYVVVAARPWYSETGFQYPAEIRQPGFGSFGPGISDRSVDPLRDVVYPITFYPNVTDAAAASELSLTAGAEDEADIQLTAVPAVHVLFTGLPEEVSNSRASYLNITASQSVFGTVVRLPSDPQDREVSPGEWEVAGLPPGPVTLTFGGYRLRWSHRTITVKLSEGETIDASSALAPILVSGVVIQAAGLTAPKNTQVTFNDQQGQLFSVPVQENGTFSLMLDPGRYDVHVSAGGLGYLRDLSASGARVKGHMVTIPASGDVNLTLTTGRGVGVVKGIAKLAGSPDPGVLVLLVPVSGQDVSEDSRRDQSNSDGSFTLSNIIPGRYTLVAIANGWKIDWTDPAILRPYRDRGQVLDIAPGQTQTVTANVQPLLK
jgi:hypothetical protein